jgi:hypothetical protein
MVVHRSPSKVSDAGEDFIPCLGPYEGFGIFTGEINELRDRAFESAHTAVASAAQLLDGCGFQKF